MERGAVISRLASPELSQLRTDVGELVGVEFRLLGADCDDWLPDWIQFGCKLD